MFYYFTYRRERKGESEGENEGVSKIATVITCACAVTLHCKEMVKWQLPE